MDRRERYRNDEETLRSAIFAAQTRLWTTMPGIVQRYNSAKMTVDVQPAINGVLRNKDGTTESLTMPVLLDCPVLWQGGGGATLVFPIAAGDECLVSFSSRCIDGWFGQGGTQDATEFRMHDLSDGFAAVGLRSLPRAFAIDPGVVRLRTDDDSAYWEFNPTAKTFKVVALGGITLNGVTIDSSSNVAAAHNINATATITGATDVVGGGKHLATHTHSGVTTGSGTSGPPT